MSFRGDIDFALGLSKGRAQRACEFLNWLLQFCTP